MPIDLTPDRIGGGGSFEVMRKNIFEVIIDGITADDMRIACVGCPFPKFNVTEMAMPYKNVTIKLAGKSNLEQDFTLRLRDVVDGNVRNALWAWSQLVFEIATGKIGRQSSYKKDGTLFMAGPDGGDEQQWKMMGIWPKTIDFGEGSADDAAPVEISCTLAVDMIDKV